MAAPPAEVSDPRVAPALCQLTTVATQVHAVWARMGVSSTDRHHRWDTFLHTSLLPFIEDFGRLQTAAELNAATENDALLREVCYLATRLDEAPRHADVETIVALLKRHYTRTPMQSPLLGATAQRAGQQRSAEYSEGAEGNGDDGDDMIRSGSGGVDTAGVATPPARRSTKELMFLSLPSFTEFIQKSADTATMATAAEEDVPVKQEVMSRPSAHDGASNEQTNWISSGDEANEGEETATAAHERTALLPASPPAEAARAALQHLMHGSTHEGVRRHLQAELDRLKSLADNRFRVLQLLCKQRAILNLSATEQVALRAAYRTKYLCEDVEGEGALERLTSTGPAASAAAARAASTAALVHVVEPSVSPPSSALFFSLPPSPKSSAGGDSSSGSGGNNSTGGVAKCTAPAVTQGRATLQAATQAELQLLLSAASCSLDTPTNSWDANAIPAIAPLHGESDALRHAKSGMTTWLTCSSSSVATASSHPPTTQTSTVPNGSSSLATTTATVVGGGVGRPTVCDVDTSSITDYGTHQDLTLARIQREAEAILAAISEQNRRLQTEAQAEVQAFETLEVLWRAMSTQRTTPRVSPQTSDTPESQPPPPPPPQHSAGERGGAAETPSAVAAVDSMMAPLSPAPFEATKSEVMAHYTALCEAFAADVAAQRPTNNASAVQHVGFTASTLANAAAAAAAPQGLPLVGDGSQAFLLTSSTRATAASSSTPSLTFSDTARTRVTAENLYLPPVVRQVLRAASFAPVFDYIHRTRLAFQKHLSTQQGALVEKVMARLRTVYKVYYAATRDAAYAVAPDGELRVAMEEELLETLSTATSTVPPPPISGKVLLSFQRHLTACQQVREQAVDEMEYLRLRLRIIEQAEPLVCDYQSILREAAEMQASSRERLLSKKVNMAKQLLQEEKVRRRVAKDVPRIVAHLTELVAAWDALQAGAEPREDANSTSVSSRSTELYIRGQRVRDLLTRGGVASSSANANNNTTTTAASRTRPRSVSARTAHTPQQPQSSGSRSVSPVVPASSRVRVETASQRRVVSPTPSLSTSQTRWPLKPTERRATPSPQPTSRLYPERSAGVGASGRPLSRSPSFASATAATTAKRAGPLAPSPSAYPHSQPTAASGASHLRSVSPGMGRGLSATSVNTSQGPKEKASARQSPAAAPLRGHSTPHSAPFTTSFSSHS